MSKGKNQHVIKHPDGWGIKGEGNAKFTRIVPLKSDAIKIATRIAKNQQSDTKIHGADGKIQAGNSYGNDPYPPKDTK